MAGDEERWQALSVDGLQVGESLIPGAGLGLFSTRAREKGELLCRYHGTLLRTCEALRLADKSYLMRLGPQCYVDARDHVDVLCRYMNDCRNRRGYNVAFQKLPDEGCALALASRDLAAGEELYVDYGKWYWLGFKEGVHRLSDEELLAIQQRGETKKCSK
jgi:hypothetical protein